jgi:hypothetical protein
LLPAASLAALQGQLFLPAQICTQGQVMFLAYSVRMMRAACIARFLDGSRTLFENLGTGHQKTGRRHARSQDPRIVNRNF